MSESGCFSMHALVLFHSPYEKACHCRCNQSSPWWTIDSHVHQMKWDDIVKKKYVKSIRLASHETHLAYELGFMIVVVFVLKIFKFFMVKYT